MKNYDTSRVQQKGREIEVKSQDGRNAGESCKRKKKTLRETKIEKDQVFGRLTAVSSEDEINWMFLCRCGNTKNIPKYRVLSGDTRSCGCLQRESISKIAKTHGMSGIPEYRIWAAMIRRCHCTKDKAFHNYGERGIIVCDEWRNSFNSFIKDIGFRPNKKLSIHRIDNDLGYSANNCKWATSHEQSLFKRTTKYHEFNGKRLTLRGWSELLNLPSNMLHQRIHKLKWSYEKAFSTPNLSKIRKYGLI